MEIVLLVGAPGVECVTLPGWVVVVVAMLLTAPRLIERYLAES